MNKLFLLVLTTLLFIGFSSSTFANECTFEMNLTCPPHFDPQVFVNGLDVQINGYAGAGDLCPAVDRINLDWGDGSNNDAWFAALHTYSTVGDYTITGTSYYGGIAVASSSCTVSICQTDSDCDDGLFCTGNETCVEGTCAAVSACPPSIDGCVYRNDSCDEANDQCVDFLDDSLCTENEMCVASGDCIPVYDCVGFHVPFDEPKAVKKKSNRALPLKFNLFDWYPAEITDLDPPPVVEVRVLGVTDSVIAGYDGELLPAGLSDDGNEFRYDLESGQWILNLDMKAYTASTTYTISVVAGNGSYVIDGCTQEFTRQN